MSLQKASELRRLRHQLPWRADDFLGGALTSTDEERHFLERLDEEIKTLTGRAAELRNHLPVDDFGLARLSEQISRASILRRSWKVSNAGRILEKAWKLAARLEAKLDVARLEQDVTDELDEIFRRLVPDLWGLPSLASARSLLELASERRAADAAGAAGGILEVLQKIIDSWRCLRKTPWERVQLILARLRDRSVDRALLKELEDLFTTDQAGLADRLLAELDMQTGDSRERDEDWAHLRKDLAISLQTKSEVVYKSLCGWIEKRKGEGWKI